MNMSRGGGGDFLESFSDQLSRQTPHDKVVLYVDNYNVTAINTDFFGPCWFLAFQFSVLSSNQLSVSSIES